MPQTTNATAVQPLRGLLCWSVVLLLVGGVAITLREMKADQFVAASEFGEHDFWLPPSRVPQVTPATAPPPTGDAAPPTRDAAPVTSGVPDRDSPPVRLVGPAPRIVAPRTSAPAPQPVAATSERGWAPQATAPGVHLVDLDTGRVRQLAGRSSFRGLPSPDGRRIAYVAAVDAAFRFRIEVAAVQGSEVEVAANALDGSVIGWAPDSRSLLVAIRTPGADDPTVTETHILTLDGRTRRVSPTGIDALPIGWSAVTNLIAYQAPDGTHVVEPSGSNDRLVQSWDGGDHRQIFATGWSPTGPELLFKEVDGKVNAKLEPRDDHTIFALDPVTGARRVLAKPVKSPAFAGWSPDGLALAYTTEHRPGNVAWTSAGSTGEVAHELDWAGRGNELIAIRPSRDDGPREVVGITFGGSVRTILGAREGGTYFNIAGIPGARLAVVDIAPEAAYR